MLTDRLGRADNDEVRAKAAGLTVVTHDQPGSVIALPTSCQPRHQQNLSRPASLWLKLALVASLSESHSGVAWLARFLPHEEKATSASWRQGYTRLAGTLLPMLPRGNGAGSFAFHVGPCHRPRVSRLGVSQ